jgi:hypothetical protein
MHNSYIAGLLNKKGTFVNVAKTINDAKINVLLGLSFAIFRIFVKLKQLNRNPIQAKVDVKKGSDKKYPVKNLTGAIINNGTTGLKYKKYLFLYNDASCILK